MARFSEKGLRESLQRHGIECIEADLLDRAKVEALPKLPNVVFMAGRKFGSIGYEDLTWAMNAYVPALVAETFSQSRIVAFSTGNVYPWVNIAHGGATEDTPAVPPPGTYANSCVARENLFQYFSRIRGTPGRIIRLNYAIDMRYGVLHDVATRVHTGKTIDLTTAQVNVIWQGDANAMILRSLAHCTVPSSPLNVSGPEPVSIRWLATALGKRLGKTPVFSGTESTEGWLTNTAEAMRLFGYPTVPLGRMIDWVADWVARDMPSARQGHALRFARWRILIHACRVDRAADRARSWPTPKRWCARPAGTRLSPTGGCFCKFGKVHAAPNRERPRHRDRGDVALWRPLRLDQHGAGGARRFAAAGSRRSCCGAASTSSSRRNLSRCSMRRRRGGEVYRALGFRDSWGFQRYARSEMPPRSRRRNREIDFEIHAIDDAVWRELCAYDAAVFGADRSGLLADLRMRASAGLACTPSATAAIVGLACWDAMAGSRRKSGRSSPTTSDGCPCAARRGARGHPRPGFHRRPRCEGRRHRVAAGSGLCRRSGR